MAPVRAAAKAYDAPALEREVQARWKADGTRAAVRAARAKAKRFRFIDGPPYTSGHIHLGTAQNKVLKDTILRYQTMRGRLVRDQPGYDMHGLPIEVRVEKELGIQSKGEIEERGVERFVEQCRAFSLRFLDAMTEEFAQLGVWLDWDRPYRTIDNTYIEAAWWTLAQAQKKGLLYADDRVLSWCPRCQTALAEAELEYWDEQDPSLFVKLALADDPHTFLVIWTTTPWTLPANLAIAAHPESTYATVWCKRGGLEENLVVEESLVERVVALGKYEAHAVIEHRTGRELDGVRYVHPLAEDVPYHQHPPSERCHTVVLGLHVTADQTGLVHTAPGHGADDFETGRSYGIPGWCVLGPDGRMNADAGRFAGMDVKAANDAVIAALDGSGHLLAKAVAPHRYGHCWRCKTPILFRTTNQWFLAVTKVRDQMLSEVARIRWTPEWAGAARQRDWVQNVRDWCISRQRYWGIPLPVWKCPEGCTEVVGSVKELSRRSKTDCSTLELHRPWIDRVTWKCKKHRSLDMTRAPDVLDVWFDSACAAWASLGYPSDKKAFREWFPTDFIVEGLDQTRGWFYSQLAAGVVAHGRVPYEEVLMHGFVHDQEGRPMSKSLGNIIAPSEIIQKYGADSLRFALLAGSAPWEDTAFGRDSARAASRSLNILWNVHVFATQYMALDAFSAAGKGRVAGARPEDKWLLSRLARVVETVTAETDVHHHHRACRAVESFVLDDLSRWYVRLVRERAWKGTDEEKRVLYETLHRALTVTARLLAPFCPHVTERMWADLGGEGSIHAQPWPKAAELGRPDDRLEARMAIVRDTVESAARARERANLGLRWPVARIVVSGNEAAADAVKALKPLLLSQTNARKVQFVGHDWKELRVTAKPVPRAIGPVHQKAAQVVIDAIKQTDAGALKDALATGEARLSSGDHSFAVTPAMVEFGTDVPEGVSGEPFEGGAVYVDTHLTDELRAMGLARELLRRIQELRKRAQLDIEAQCKVSVHAPDDFVAAVRPHVGLVQEEARATVEFVGASQAAPQHARVSEATVQHILEDEIQGHRVVVAIKT